MVQFFRHIIACTLGVLASCAALGTSLSETEARSLIHRRLEDDNAYFQYDLTEFSVRFDRCQYVKMYDDELAQDEDSDSPLATKHFVVFRLCPSDDCDSCSNVFGRYVMEIDDYLKYTVEEQDMAFQYMCENCQEKCNEDGEYCSGCGKLCYQYQNLENNGYVDAADYIECQQIDMNNGDDGGGGDDGMQLYIGPRCSRDGSRVLIGLFSDEDCLEPYTYEEPETYLGANISYHLLAHTNTNDGSYCLSCKESDEDENAEDQEDADDVNEMCENIYAESAKCESMNGIGGFIQTQKEDGDVENQVENEFMVCGFINSLIWNSYTETGDINYQDVQDEIIRSMTGLQKATISMLAVSVVGLLTLAYFTQKHIESSYPKVDLACQSDAQLT